MSRDICCRSASGPRLLGGVLPRRGALLHLGFLRAATPRQIVNHLLFVLVS